MLKFYVRRQHGWVELQDVATIRWIRHCNRNLNRDEHLQRFVREGDVLLVPEMFVTLYEVRLFETKKRVHTRIVELFNGERCELVGAYRDRVPTRPGYWQPGL